MIAKTKKYQLTSKEYVRAGMWCLFREQWKYIGVPLGIILFALIMPDEKWWFIISGLIVFSLYVGFWYIQYLGVTQMEQGKILFEKLSYEIDSRQILIKLNERQGSPIKWEMIQKVYKRKNDYLFIMGRGQFFLFPFKIFSNENDLRFVDSILTRKELIK
jgi:hypothetical protein